MSALTASNIKKFVADWYYALDIHASAADCEKFLASEDLELVFPEQTMRTYAEFEAWLEIIYRTFFDELHNVIKVDIKNLTETSADLDVIVAWQASWFTPPDAKSKRTAMNAFQRWNITSSDQNSYGLVIVKYYVDRFEYAPGFAQL
jgi:hypothetical protein